MVFLRLTVKVSPRAPINFTRSSSTRSVGSRDDDVTLGDSYARVNEAHDSLTKPVSFLVVLENPEEVTLGALAGIIKEKWVKLRPDAGPLEIKKLLDDAHESDDLDADLTVADVWVDIGKGMRDGLDQRGTVRVVQKPTVLAPVRFPSVAQDWDAAAEEYERMNRIKRRSRKNEVRNIPAIEEEGEPDAEDRRTRRHGGRPTPTILHQKDILLPSVERDQMSMPVVPSWGKTFSTLDEEDSQNQNLGSPIVVNTPQHTQPLGSQELAGSPMPTPSVNVRAKSSLENQIGRVLESQSFIPRSAAEPAGLKISVRGRESESPLGTRTPPFPLQLQAFCEPNDSRPSQENQSCDVHMVANGNTSADMIPGDDSLGLLLPANEVSDVGAGGAQNAKCSSMRPGLRSGKKRKSHVEYVTNKQPRLELSESPNENNSSTNDSQLKTKSANESTHVVTGAPAAVGERDSEPSLSSQNLHFSITEDSAQEVDSRVRLDVTKIPPGNTAIQQCVSQELIQIDESGLGSPKPTVRTPTAVSEAKSQADMSTPPITPSNESTLATERKKLLHSALRKNSSADRPHKGHSVSFAEDDNDRLARSTSTSLPRPSPKSKTKSISEPRNSSPKSSNGGTMVFPADVSASKIEQYQKEAEEKQRRQNEQRMEYERKIKAAEEDMRDPEYLRLLRQVYRTWTDILNCEKSGRKKVKAKANKLRTLLPIQQKTLEEYEMKMERELDRTGPDKSGVQTNTSNSKKATIENEDTNYSKTTARNGTTDRRKNWSAPNGANNTSVEATAITSPKTSQISTQATSKDQAESSPVPDAKLSADRAMKEEAPGRRSSTPSNEPELPRVHNNVHPKVPVDGSSPDANARPRISPHSTGKTSSKRAPKASEETEDSRSSEEDDSQESSDNEDTDAPLPSRKADPLRKSLQPPPSQASAPAAATASERPPTVIDSPPPSFQPHSPSPVQGFGITRFKPVRETLKTLKYMISQAQRQHATPPAQIDSTSVPRSLATSRRSQFEGPFSDDDDEDDDDDNEDDSDDDDDDCKR